jgi:hypothetical protein
MFLEPSQNPAAKTDQPTQKISTAPTKHKPEFSTAETLEGRHWHCLRRCLPSPTPNPLTSQKPTAASSSHPTTSWDTDPTSNPKAWYGGPVEKMPNTSDTDLRQGIRTAAWITVIANFKYKVHAHDTFEVGEQVR